MPVIDFNMGWETIQRGMDKAVSLVDADGLNPDENTSPFTSNELMEIYHMQYHLCIQQHNNMTEMYNRCTAFFQKYVHTKVLPAVSGKNGEHLLREVAKRWRDYKLVTRQVSHFFLFLERHFIAREKDSTMGDTALLILHEQGYEEIKEQINSTILTLIREDRDGNSVDRALIKEVLETVYDFESRTSQISYLVDFEPALLKSSCSYYFIKFMQWRVTALSSSDYMSQVTECMNEEKVRAMQFLYPSTVSNLLEAINNDVINRVEQLELVNNSIRTIREVITMDDAAHAGCLPNTSEETMDDNSSLLATSEKPMDGDDGSEAISEEIMDDDFVLL